ncbi:RpiR family transcriptional regulator [Tahibacter aquaticus]|uniref:RpiR family transcriptional regulator n=1 Tax=Tahibacter aquaticus TaxID=520092 RepID=A0A4R6YN24_9GAMM|nr:RpiR family transcriptional regulator [Tahibacter aquaticus]
MNALSPLVRIRAERDQMSAIERRIADFLLDNAHLLRDYSSQQLANALKISQSSVVKFSQKLGFKGYPDLKFSIGESVAHHRAIENAGQAEGLLAHPYAALADSLWRRKMDAEKETRLINAPAQLEAIAAMIAAAPKLVVSGLGEDGIQAQSFALRLSLLGLHCVHHGDPVLLSTALAGACHNDVMLVFSEHGKQPALAQVSRDLRARGGKVVSITRHTANVLRAHADQSLLVSAHDERAEIEPLLYRAALQHLLDVLFLALCERHGERLVHLQANVERLRQLLDP